MAAKIRCSQDETGVVFIRLRSLSYDGTRRIGPILSYFLPFRLRNTTPDKSGKPEGFISCVVKGSR